MPLSRERQEGDEEGECNQPETTEHHTSEAALHYGRFWAGEWACDRKPLRTAEGSAGGTQLDCKETDWIWRTCRCATTSAIAKRRRRNRIELETKGDNSSESPLHHFDKDFLFILLEQAVLLQLDKM